MKRKKKSKKKEKKKPLLEKENNYSTCSKHRPTLLGCASLAISKNKYINYFEYALCKTILTNTAINIIVQMFKCVSPHSPNKCFKVSILSSLTFISF